MKPYLQQIGRFALLLLIIQMVRAFIITGLWRLLHPAPDSPLWAVMDMVAFGLIGLSLLLYVRPSGAQLGLDWSGAPRWEIAIYIGLGILTLGLVLGTYFLTSDVFIANISSAIVIPIFEELLFRGWGWGYLRKAASFRASGFANWLVISALFAFWHVGYLDIYILKVAPANPDMDWGFFFLMKLLTTLIIGLVVGLPRWRSGRVYGSLILHSLINIFGR
jgi:membrane protease YdiL (CAAX protease family)